MNIQSTCWRRIPGYSLFSFTTLQRRQVSPSKERPFEILDTHGIELVAWLTSAIKAYGWISFWCARMLAIAHSFGKSRRASCKSLSEQHWHCHVAAMCIRKRWEWKPVGSNHLLWQVSRKHQGQGGNHTAVDPAIDRRKPKHKNWLHIASLHAALHTKGCSFHCGNKSCTDK